MSSTPAGGRRGDGRWAGASLLGRCSPCCRYMAALAAFSWTRSPLSGVGATLECVSCVLIAARRWPCNASTRAAAFGSAGTVNRVTVASRAILPGGVSVCDFSASFAASASAMPTRPADGMRPSVPALRSTFFSETERSSPSKLARFSKPASTTKGRLGQAGSTSPSTKRSTPPPTACSKFLSDGFAKNSLCTSRLGTDPRNSSSVSVSSRGRIRSSTTKRVTCSTSSASAASLPVAKPMSIASCASSKRAWIACRVHASASTVAFPSVRWLSTTSNTICTAVASDSTIRSSPIVANSAQHAEASGSARSMARCCGCPVSASLRCTRAVRSSVASTGPPSASPPWASVSNWCTACAALSSEGGMCTAGCAFWMRFAPASATESSQFAHLARRSFSLSPSPERLSATSQP
mmetsp:Transcript_19279/g.57122  ORF Transcript_19279/g.57122 Transcript_19279/m.57122 type:complete len:409 (+) Transcript_19279:282-1508(+)